jgi:hypothetical protein
MLRKLVILGLVLALCMAVIPGVLAADGNRGNHEAIWKSPQHGSLESGQQWGPMVSEWARAQTDNPENPMGVSEGVHLAKGQPVPGQNK